MGVEKPIDPKRFREVLGHFPTGVTVVTARSGDQRAGATIGSFCSISLEPPLVGFFLDVEAGSAAVIQEAGAFCVNVLASDQQELSNLMAGRGDDKFSSVQFAEPAHAKGPELDQAIAVIHCDISRVETLGDHFLIVGLVQSLQVLRENAEPLLYFKGQYGSFGPVTLP